MQLSNLEDNQSVGTARRGRRAKPFPLAKFEEVIVIAQTIVEDGINDRLRRLTLFDRLGRSPTSGLSRNLITSSRRYGLTSGSHSAEYLTLTEDGKAVVTQDSSLIDVREKIFECAIGRFDVFNQLYESMKNGRIPAEDVLRDQFLQWGLEERDCHVASEVFIANVRYIGLIREVSGTEHLIPIEQLIEEIPLGVTKISVENTEDSIEDPAPDQLDESPITLPQVSPSSSIAAQPTLHIDIQIHIDSTAGAEQIDQIFSSMARHLYGARE